MKQGLKPFLLRWFCTTLAVAVAVQLTGMQADGWPALLGTALFLGIINAAIRPVLLLLSLPFIILTLGFSILLLNAVLLALAGGLVPGFHVGGFWNAFFGAIVISLVNGVLGLVFKTGDSSLRIHTRRIPPPPGAMKQVEGRVVEDGGK